MPRRKIERNVHEKTYPRLNRPDGCQPDLSRASKAALPLICERIRFFRERQALDQKTLADRIGVTANAVSNWENGRSRPDINLLPDICRVLEITLYELFGEDPPRETLTEEEKGLLETFRALKPGYRRAVAELSETLFKLREAEDQPDVKRLIHYARSLAAGRGDPSEFEEEGAPIYLYVSRETEAADCVFSVSGDSMEPDYHSGDRVMVSRIENASDLQPGETGAFIYGNETYIKVYQPDGLHSLNPAYPVMHFDETGSVYLIGRVIGTVQPYQVASDEAVRRYLLLHPEEA